MSENIENYFLVFNMISAISIYQSTNIYVCRGTDVT